jgi:2-polyprenyl-3-methyl-5-hydroxy-6-metoxy-1,4-benzoquinol methylase
MSTIYTNKKQLINTLIRESDVVLDLGFWGQGVMMHHDNWVHRLLLNRAREVYGLDVEFDPTQVAKLPHPERYKKGTAEDFDFDVKFDVILVADLIEHLSNLGSFLDSCARNLKANGRIVITTPNCFNLFNMASKLTKIEPIMNKDETVYFNHRALRQLLGKHGWKVEEASYLYSLGVAYRESYRKKFLNVLYYVLSKFTPKFVETIVVIAKRS